MRCLPAFFHACLLNCAGTLMAGLFMNLTHQAGIFYPLFFFPEVSGLRGDIIAEGHTAVDAFPVRIPEALDAVVHQVKP